MYNNILLASHGSIGAKKAEHTALEMSNSTTQVTHLYVVPELWKHILGDDWLNNACTHKQFGDYLETLLEQEINQTCMRIQNKFESRGLSYTQKVSFGQPQQCLLDTYIQSEFDVVVMGSSRPKDMYGLKSKMLSKKVARILAAKLVVVPHPNA